MFKKHFSITTLFTLTGFMMQAQIFDVAEKVPLLQNGFEYGYIVKNEQVKNVKAEEYNRFELTLYITNKSGCTKLYADRPGLLSYEVPNLLSTFTCINANGKRFTSKSGSIKANNFYVNIKKTVNGKETTDAIKAGYILKNGETITASIIVLVPKDERPKIQCVLNSLPELQ